MRIPVAYLSFLFIAALSLISGCKQKQSTNNNPPPKQPPAKTPGESVDTSPSPSDKEHAPKDSDLHPSDRAPSEDKVASEVRQIVEELLGARKKAIDAKQALMIKEIGADELDLVEMVMELEDQFNVTINDDDLGKTEELTLEKLTNVVRKVRRRQLGK